MLHWTNEERRFLAVVSLVLLLLTAGGAAFLWYIDRESLPPVEAGQAEAFRQFQLSVEEADSLRNHPGSMAASRSARLFPFDPNHADSLTLRKLGMRPWQVSNLLKYRRKGGVWRSPDDLSRLYGLSQADFERLRPYIRIRPSDAVPHYPASRRLPAEYPSDDRPALPRQEKYAEGTRLPLNTADTTQLKGIPGIGSYKARRITAYRERLGGFVSTAQLEELDDMPPGLSRWFTADSVPPRRIRLNRATFKQLVRHPYLSYEQTKAIVNHIRKYGPLRSWRELRLYPEFTADDFRRLEPYFSFD